MAVSIAAMVLVQACSGGPEDQGPPAALATTPTASAPVAGSPALDRAALVALYNATDGANWEISTNWLTDRPIGEWHGVTVDGDGRVTKLGLAQNQLSGPIPAELGRLTNLKLLWLFGNQLSGPIPAELGGLTNLEGLWLSGNQLSGPIPAELGDLTYLHALGLFGNQLSGCIPGELGEIFRNDVDALGLPFCEPPAPVATTPAPIASAPVAGSATQDRAALVALYNATDGAHWQTSTHWLTDRPIGEWHGVTVDGEGRVTQLWLFGNQLSGPIPAELASLSNLRGLELYDNQLSGRIPTDLGRPPYLRELFLGDNQFSGCIHGGLGEVPQNDVAALGLPFCN